MPEENSDTIIPKVRKKQSVSAAIPQGDQGEKTLLGHTQGYALPFVEHIIRMGFSCL